MFQFLSGSAMIFIIVAVFFLMSAIKILNEYERGVIFRLGRALDHAKGPGLIILIPIVDKMVKVNLQLVTYEVPSQDIITTHPRRFSLHFRQKDRYPRCVHRSPAGALPAVANRPIAARDGDTSGSA